MLLQSFLSTVYHVFLPISFPVIGGALLKRFRGLDTKPLSALALYVLSPALIFQALHKAHISVDDIWQTAAFALTNLFVLWGAAVAVSKLLALPPAERAGLTMISTFTNSVNYGLPLVLLAFGQAGLDKASVYVIMQMLTLNTLGIYFAARSHFSIKNAFISVFKMPTVYAAAVAVTIKLTGLEVPEGVDRGFTFLADAFSPVVLAVLGAQMMNVNKDALPIHFRKAFWAGMFIRLVAAPALALALLFALRIEGVLFSVILILASMPAAVNAVLFAEQFNAAPQFVAKCILWTTLASLLYLPAVLILLQ
jgi:predicted permease